jgi:arylsulfatase A-like enzyme
VSTAERPDIVVVVWDGARALDLSLYGYPADTSTFLSSFSQQAFVYQRAISPSPWCIPAIGSILTGRLPSQHGAHELAWRLPADVPTLPSLLSAAGYHTVGVSGTDLAGPAFGLSRGFARFATPATAGSRLRRKPAERSADRVNRLFEKELADAPDDRPLFAAIVHSDTHPPFRAPKPWRHRFLPPWAKPEDADRLPQSPLAHATGTDGLDDRDLDVVRTMYQGSLRFLDERFEQVVQLLRLTGRLERTVVAVVGAHGQSIGEQGVLGSHGTLHQTVLWVPLVVRVPGLGGARLPQLVQTHDLFPTLLAIGGAEAPPLTDAGRLPGPGDRGRSYAISEYLAPFPPRDQMRRRMPDVAWDRIPERGLRAVQDSEGMKLVAGTDGTTMLVDVTRDAEEMVNLLDDSPVTAGRLVTVLKGTPRPSNLPEREPPVDDETFELLREAGQAG